MALTDVKDLNLDLDTRQRFSINGDATKLVVLDTHDLGIVSRLSNAVKQISALQKKWDALAKKANDLQQLDEENIVLDEVDNFSGEFNALEQEMRHLIDGIFDSEGMCDTIMDDTSIFSLKDGEFKYNIIIDKFINLYEKSIKAEADKINRKKIQNKTAKYVRHA